MKDYLRPSQIAVRLKVSKNTVINWINAGRLKALDVSSEGAIRPAFRCTDEHIAELETLLQVNPKNAPVERKRAKPKPARKYF